MATIKLESFPLTQRMLLFFGSSKIEIDVLADIDVDEKTLSPTVTEVYPAPQSDDVIELPYLLNKLVKDWALDEVRNTDNEAMIKLAKEALRDCEDNAA